MPCPFLNKRANQHDQEADLFVATRLVLTWNDPTCIGTATTVDTRDTVCVDATETVCIDVPQATQTVCCTAVGGMKVSQTIETAVRPTATATAAVTAITCCCC